MEHEKMMAPPPYSSEPAPMSSVIVPSAVQYDPPLQMTSAAGVIVMPSAPSAPAVGPRPATLFCPQCQKRVTTKTWKQCQKSAHRAACCLFLFGCWLCCCLPYCMDSYNTVHHKCPECDGFIGSFSN